jgi:hypothetical protein
VRDVLALIGFQGMVNEIVQGILDPLPLDGTSKVETFHPLCSCPTSLRSQPHQVTCDSGGSADSLLQELGKASQIGANRPGESAGDEGVGHLSEDSSQA